MDFETFIDRLLDEVDRSHANVETYLRRATIRSLKALSKIRVPWQEGTFSFETVAAQAEYGPADGLPEDVVTIDFLYTQQSTGVYEISLRPLAEVRLAKDVTVHGLYAAYPCLACWHHERLILAPVIGGVTVYGDYLKDARRDETSGSLITEEDTTTTNAWFDQGEDILRCRVLMDYYASFARDEASLATYSGLYSQGLADARSLVTSKRAVGVVSRYSF